MEVGQIFLFLCSDIRPHAIHVDQGHLATREALTPAVYSILGLCLIVIAVCKHHVRRILMLLHTIRFVQMPHRVDVIMIPPSISISVRNSSLIEFKLL